MRFPTIVLLGAIAGFTIYLGLPVARLRNLSRSWQAFLNAIATGILLFLFWDVVSKASEPIQQAVDTAQKGSPGSFITLVAIFVLGLTGGLMGLVYFERMVIRRTAEETRSGGATPCSSRSSSPSVSEHIISRKGWRSARQREQEPSIWRRC